MVALNRRPSSIRPVARIAGALALAVASLFVAPSTASAQMGAWRAMAGGMSTPSVNARQLKLYAKVLDLSPEQRKAAEELLGTYEAEYLAAIKRFQEIQKSMNEEFMQTGDMAGIQEAVQDAMKKFSKKTTKLESSLLDDLKSILESKQLERWPLVERLHRRMTTVTWGSLSGESVDLVDLVEGLRLPADQSTPLSSLLERYETDLDKLLAKRNAIIQQQMQDWMNGGMMNFDFEKMKEQAKDLRNAGKSIVDLNKNYATQINAALAPVAQAEFSDKVKLASFPTVYRKSYAARVLEAAEKLTDLDATQRESLKTLHETYTRDAGAASDAWAVAIADNEMNPEDDNPFASFMPNRKVPGKIKDAPDAREAIDNKTIEAVNALLTEAQRAKLPEKKYRPEFDFDTPSGAK